MCDGTLLNWPGIESFENDPDQTIAKLTLDISDRGGANGARVSVIKEAVIAYINGSNKDDLPVMFSCAASETEPNQMLLLVTKKGAVEGDK